MGQRFGKLVEVWRRASTLTYILFQHAKVLSVYISDPSQICLVQLEYEIICPSEQRKLKPLDLASNVFVAVVESLPSCLNLSRSLQFLSLPFKSG